MTRCLSIKHSGFAFETAGFFFPSDNTLPEITKHSLYHRDAFHGCYGGQLVNRAAACFARGRREKGGGTERNGTERKPLAEAEAVCISTTVEFHDSCLIVSFIFLSRLFPAHPSGFCVRSTCPVSASWTTCPRWPHAFRNRVAGSRFCRVACALHIGTHLCT